MKKIIAVSLLSLLILAGCSNASKPEAGVSAAAMPDIPKVTGLSGNGMIPFMSELTSGDVSKIYYFDDSQPPGSPAAAYTAKEEIAGVIEKLQHITLERDVTEESISTPAPGDFCGYEIHLKDGGKLTVQRSGHEIRVDGKRYEYTGDFDKQLHIDEVVINADCSIVYPRDGRIMLNIKAFDEQNTTAVDAPVLKQFDGSGWNIVEPVSPGSGARIPVSDILYVDLKNRYPQVSEGDYKITYDIYLPDGEKTSVTAQFTIFEG